MCTTKTPKVQDVSSQGVQSTQTFASFVKEKIGLKLNRIKKNFEETFFANKLKDFAGFEQDMDVATFPKNEPTIKVLESDK